MFDTAIFVRSPEGIARCRRFESGRRNGLCSPYSVVEIGCWRHAERVKDGTD